MKVLLSKFLSFGTVYFDGEGSSPPLRPRPSDSLNEILTYEVRTIWMKATEQYFPVVLFIMFWQHWACGFNSN